MRQVLVFIILFQLFATPSFGFQRDEASDDPEIQALEKEKMKAELERDIATARMQARTANDARLATALGNLPKFDSDVTINEGALDGEAHLMAMVAVKAASLAIRNQMTDKKYIRIIGQSELRGYENPQFLTNSINENIAALKQACLDTGNSCAAVDTSNFSVAAGVAAFNAISGLLQSKVELTAIALDTVDDNFMALHVANEFAKAKLASINPNPSAESELLNSFQKLSQTISMAEGNLALLSAAQKENDAKSLQAILTLIQQFSNNISSPGADGTPSRLLRAAILDGLSVTSDLLVIDVEKASSTALELDNIGVAFGDDPLRISATLIVTWKYFTKDGLSTHGSVSCHTAPKSYRRIQHGRWLRKTFEKVKKLGGLNLCQVSTKYTSEELIKYPETRNQDDQTTASVPGQSTEEIPPPKQLPEDTDSPDQDKKNNENTNAKKRIANIGVAYAKPILSYDLAFNDSF